MKFGANQLGSFNSLLLLAVPGAVVSLNKARNINSAGLSLKTETVLVEYSSPQENAVVDSRGGGGDWKKIVEVRTSDCCQNQPQFWDPDTGDWETGRDC